MDVRVGPKDGWAPKNWCFWTLVLEKTLESPLDCKEIKAVNPKGNHPWIFIGRTDVEAEAPILWPPDAKSQLFRKDPDPEKDWGKEKKRLIEDEMVGWHHWPDGHEFEQSPEVGDGEGSLVGCSPWIAKRHDLATEQQQTVIWMHRKVSISLIKINRQKKNNGIL